MALSGILFLNDRDVLTDFGLVVSEMAGWPGMLAGAPRDVPFLDGPEMSGAILDPRLLRRRSGTATIVGTIRLASSVAALAALDALRGVVSTGGEVAVRTIYATDRYCLSVCTSFDGALDVQGIADGNIKVTLSFTIKDGVALRLQPDGYALSTTRVACPIWTAESKPVVVVHGGGAALTNPVITVRNAAGSIVQTMSFTVSLGSTAALRIDAARTLVSLVTAGVITDAMVAGYWPIGSGDYPLLRPYDANPEAGAYPTVELSASSGTPVGRITYTRRAA
jgi:hypothetical protein